MFTPAQFVFCRSRKTLERCEIGRCRRRLEFMQPSSSFPNDCGAATSCSSVNMEICVNDSHLTGVTQGKAE